MAPGQADAARPAPGARGLMLSPDSRTVAFDLLRPPAGYNLDFALLTTYTLDLEALLALPLSLVARADNGLEDLLADPLLLLEALRRAGERIHVFVDRGRHRGPPQKTRALRDAGAKRASRARAGRWGVSPQGLGATFPVRRRRRASDTRRGPVAEPHLRPFVGHRSRERSSTQAPPADFRKPPSRRIRPTPSRAMRGAIDPF